MIEPTFDSIAFLDDHWPDLDRLLRFMRSYNCALLRQAIQKWHLRGSIPAQWFAIMLALMEIESGRPVSLVKYIRT
jgi:hypothetical protein